MGDLGHHIALFGVQGRRALRNPLFVVLAIAQPALWVLLFSQLFRALDQLPGFEGRGYLPFLTPGIAVMTALFSSAYSGLGMLRDIDQGVVARLLTTPAAPAALVSSRVVLAGLQVMVQASIILALAASLGALPGGGVVGLMVLLLAAALLAAALAAISNALALATRRHEAVLATMNFIVLPMTFLSSMLMTPELMPGWIRTVAAINPVDWAVSAGRAGFEGRLDGAVLAHLVQLSLFALVCSALAGLAFRRFRQTI